MFNRFRKTNAVSVGAPEFIVAGLGNPGKAYTLTRHNSGFLCVDRLAERLGVKINKLKFKALIADAEIAGKRCVLMKPDTFMNNSGEAVRECAAFYKIPPEKIIVIFDDISLEPGLLRIRRKGSDGGHNGIKSIIYHLQSNNFPRIKLGVGKKPHPEYPLADWVLSKFNDKELKSLNEAIDNACEAVELIVGGEIDKAMNLYNS